MSNTFFTADLHLGHYNIIRYCNRPFSSVYEMDEAIIENWNDVVSPRDSVYVLGDFAYRTSTIYDVNKYFGRLAGNKLLILGNHDKGHVRHLPWGWVKDVYLLKGLNDYGIWLSHYAHRTWPHSFRGSWHLYGHSHDNLPPYGLSFDVGIDSHDYQLVPLEDIQTKMKALKEDLTLKVI